MNVFVILCFLSVGCVSQCALHDKVDLRAAKADSEKDFFTHEIEANGKTAKIISYFNLCQHRQTLGNALYPAQHGTHDLRPLELLYCKEARKTLTPFKRYRGSLCGAIGCLSGIALATWLDNRRTRENQTCNE